MSHVACHMSHVMCHISCVTRRFVFYQVVKLVGGGSVINRATLSSFFYINNYLFYQSGIVGIVPYSISEQFVVTGYKILHKIIENISIVENIRLTSSS